MNEKLLDGLKLLFKDEIIDTRECSPQLLAYVGDAVYELFVRIHLVSKGVSNSQRLHKASVAMVNAHTQADIINSLSHLLTEEEKDIVRRGRNSKGGTMPKNASIIEYRSATGFETLIGYLFITGDYKRLNDVLKHAIESRD